jgi:hypothetical protein
MKEKILVAAPNSVHKNYVASEYFSLIKNLTHPNYDILIVDNSPGNANKDLYEELGINYAWIDPKGKSSYHFIWESQNHIRNHFLDGDYTHLCFIETDILPPPWILEYFVSYGVPVVGAPYFIYKNDSSLLMNQQIDAFYTGGETRNFTLEESFHQMKGKMNMSFSIGFGCVMIERWVVARYPFRFQENQYVRNDAAMPSHADSFFYADLWMDGIQVYHDTSLVVEHRNLDWAKIES